jgi:hypothetical protein
MMPAASKYGVKIIEKGKVYRIWPALSFDDVLMSKHPGKEPGAGTCARL